MRRAIQTVDPQLPFSIFQSMSEMRSTSLEQQRISGIGCGLILSVFAARLLKSLIWNVSTADPLTFAVVAVMLSGVALFSSVVPSLRMARLDPARTLRNE